MANTVKHGFTSGVADKAGTFVKPQAHWNAEHAFAGGNDGEALHRDSAQTDGAAWRALLTKGANVASGATITLGTDGNVFHVTGTTTITAIATKPAGYLAVLVFDGALIVTHNAATLILRDSANYKTTAGDVLTFISEGAGNWREVNRTHPVVRKGADIASAATLTLGADGQYFHVTGTTTITAISTLPSGTIIALEFDGALILTHNAVTLILRDAANYKTTAGDMLVFISEGAGNWREICRTHPVLRKGADIASAATLTLGADGQYFHVTGTTTITAISTLPAGTLIVLEFDGVLILTYNAASLILQGSASFTTAAGDILAFISEGGGNWREAWRRLATAGAVLDRVTTDTTPGTPVTETTIYTKSIPGNTLSTNVRLRLQLLGKFTMPIDTFTDSYTFRLKYGATTLAAAVIGRVVLTGAITNQGLTIDAFLTGDGATNAQHGEIRALADWTGAVIADGFASVGIASGTAVEDSTAAKTLVVTAQATATAGFSYTMQSAILEQL